MSGVPLQALYTPDDLEGWSYDEKLGYPGEFPYTRGVYPSMYRGQPWTIRQFAGYGTAEETNRRYKFLLAQGQKGLSVAFDMPTLMATTPTIRSVQARSATAVWRSTRSKTWRHSLAASAWTRSRPP